MTIRLAIVQSNHPTVNPDTPQNDVINASTLPSLRVLVLVLVQMLVQMCIYSKRLPQHSTINLSSTLPSVT